MDVNTFEKEKETMRVWSNYNKWNELAYESRMKFWMHNMFFFLVCSMPLL